MSESTQTSQADRCHVKRCSCVVLFPQSTEAIWSIFVILLEKKKTGTFRQISVDSKQLEKSLRNRYIRLPSMEPFNCYFNRREKIRIKYFCWERKVYTLSVLSKNIWMTNMYLSLFAWLTAMWWLSKAPVGTFCLSIIAVCLLFLLGFLFPHSHVPWHGGLRAGTDNHDSCRTSCYM